MRLKILIVEDELIIAEDLKNTLEKEGYLVTDIAMDYDETFASIKAQKPDLVLLDINLNCSINGIEIAHILNSKHQIPFIFTSSYSDSATLDRVTATNPINYLVKPYQKQQLFTAIKLALNKPDSPKIINSDNIDDDTFFVKDKQNYIKINLKDILWIKSDGNYLEIHTSEKMQLVRATLSKFIKNLNSKFVRTHKSYIINITCISNIEANKVLIKNTEIPVSKMYRATLFEKLKLK